MSQKGFSSPVYYQSAARLIVAYESTNTEVQPADLNTVVYAVTPEIGTYLLSKCGGMAYKVLRYGKAKVCGYFKTIVFVAEPTPVIRENPHGTKGVEIEAHKGQGTCHVVEQYYLARKLGFKINATLLTS